MTTYRTFRAKLSDEDDSWRNENRRYESYEITVAENALYDVRRRNVKWYLCVPLNTFWKAVVDHSAALSGVQMHTDRKNAARENFKICCDPWFETRKKCILVYTELQILYVCMLLPISNAYGCADFSEKTKTNSQRIYYDIVTYNIII